MRLRANCIVGATKKETCPVAAMWAYFKTQTQTQKEPCSQPLTVGP